MRLILNFDSTNDALHYLALLQNNHPEFALGELGDLELDLSTKPSSNGKPKKRKKKAKKAKKEASPLTDAEQSIRPMIARGMSPKDIATEQGVSNGAIYQRLQSMRDKLGAKDNDDLRRKV